MSEKLECKHGRLKRQCQECETESEIKELQEENQRLTEDRESAINLMSPSWQHAASKEPDLMTRYVTMTENQFKKKNEEIERLTAIATKHATRADELYEALEKIMPAVKQYIEYEHDGDPWTEDARSMGEMDLNELDKEGVIEEILSILDKSRIEAEKGDGICN
ncbi:hypothetical protein phiV208_46 [Vibrio phage phiV208]|nr:hypothetical protein phiV208_46 [Vibrio phage phiV208]